MRCQGIEVDAARSHYPTSHNGLLRAGLVFAEEGSKPPFVWIDGILSKEDALDHPSYQRFNKIPGMDYACYKSTLFRSLNEYRKLYPRLFDVYPKTYLLPQEFLEFQREHMTICGRLNMAPAWVVKPRNSCCGRGIQIFQSVHDVQNITDSSVVQLYVDPYLINHRKFDFRFYLLIASLDPLTIFIYKEGIARFCTGTYEAPSKANRADPFVHLTNTAINVQNSSVDPENFTRLASEILAQIADTDPRGATLWDRICEACRAIIIGLYPTLLQNLPKPSDKKYAPHLFIPNHPQKSILDLIPEQEGLGEHEHSEMFSTLIENNDENAFTQNSQNKQNNQNHNETFQLNQTLPHNEISNLENLPHLSSTIHSANSSINLGSKAAYLVINDNNNPNNNLNNPNNNNSVFTAQNEEKTQKFQPRVIPNQMNQFRPIKTQFPHLAPRPRPFLGGIVKKQMNMVILPTLTPNHPVQDPLVIGSIVNYQIKPIQEPPLTVIHNYSNYHRSNSLSPKKQDRQTFSPQIPQEHRKIIFSKRTQTTNFLLRTDEKDNESEMSKKIEKIQSKPRTDSDENKTHDNSENPGTHNNNNNNKGNNHNDHNSHVNKFLDKNKEKDSNSTNNDKYDNYNKNRKYDNENEKGHEKKNEKVKNEKKPLKPRQRYFHMLGIDVMIDANLDPQVLELNDRPSLGVTVSFEQELKERLIAEEFEHVSPDGSVNGNSESSRWEQIYPMDPEHPNAGIWNEIINHILHPNTPVPQMSPPPKKPKIPKNEKKEGKKGKKKEKKRKYEN